MSDIDDVLAVFDDRDEREPTGECRICRTNLYQYCTCQCGFCKYDTESYMYNQRSPDDCHVGGYDLDDLCFQCRVRRDKAGAEYIAILTHGGTRHE